MESDKLRLLSEYNLRSIVDKDVLCVCLNDFANHIANSKSVQSYVSKIRDKIRVEGRYYKEAEWVFNDLCPKIRSSKAKEFREKWLLLSSPSPPEESDQTDILNECESFLDIRNNYFQYRGKKVFVLVHDRVVWFKGIDVANLLEIGHPKDCIRNSVHEEDRTLFMTLRGELKTPLESHRIDPQTIFFLKYSSKFNKKMKCG